jgi:hypothetical protein
MTSHRHPILRSIIALLRPSSENFAGATAAHDPSALLALQVARRAQPRHEV